MYYKHPVRFSFYKTALLIYYVFAVALLAGCERDSGLMGSTEDDPTGNTCQVRAVSESDKTTVRKFGGDVTALPALGNAGTAKLDVEIEDKLKQTFPGSNDVNRIYALVYAACMSCKMVPDPVNCKNMFTRIINAHTIIANEAMDPTVEDAKAYKNEVFSSF
jgi:hypothetical protein